MLIEQSFVGERVSGRICNLAVMGCVLDVVRGSIKHGKVANPTIVLQSSVKNNIIVSAVRFLLQIRFGMAPFLLDKKHP